jgi:haloacetate dehalogenase
MWHRVAPMLADDLTLVIADLPGYGLSDVPETDEAHTPYTKRAMASVMVEVMESLGHTRFSVAGHDRGGRVAYRMAFDHPERLSRLAVLDIVPGYEYWARMDRALALKIFHWVFLAQPHPVPERLISAAPDDFYRPTLAGGTKAGTLGAFDPRAIEHYLTPLRDPARIGATCEDYRAGAYADLDHDTADLAEGRRISVPMISIWGESSLVAAAESPLETWRRWADDVTGAAIDSGHFVCEEEPRATSDALLGFLT